MIVFDREKLDDLLGRLATGFGVKPLSIVIFFILLVLIVAFFFFSYRIIHRREQRMVSRRIEERNRAAERGLELTEAERTLVARLAATLRDPRRRYLLYTDAATFSAALKRLRREGGIDPETVMHLSRRLGIDSARLTGRLTSTAELPVGLPVVVEVGRDDRRAGSVIEQSHDGVTVSFRGAAAVPRPGSTIRIYCHGSRGIFRFTAEVLSVEGTALRIAHSTRMKQAQRRNYFRRAVSFDIVVKRGTGDTSHSTRLVDIGGGGASFADPEGLFHAGDEVTIYLTRGKDDWMPIPGEVVRTSKADRVAHVRFAHVDESTRDRIIGIVQSG